MKFQEEYSDNKNMRNIIDVKLGGPVKLGIANMSKIMGSLHRIQAGVATPYSEINIRIKNTKKLPLSNFEFDNIVLAYEHLNCLLGRPHIRPDDILDINNICRWSVPFSGLGKRYDGTRVWEESYMRENHDNFCREIGPIWKWFSRHHDLSPYLLASGLYSRIVRPPQLFKECNKRTGSLMMAYIFAKKGVEPFHLDTDTAADFFSLSLEIQDCFKYNPIKWPKILHYRSRLGKFLESNFRSSFSLSSPCR